MEVSHTPPLAASTPPPIVPPRHDTLGDIILSEPPVGRIIAEARGIYRPGRPINWREYSRLKAELEQYVGWNARRQQLRNAACWTIAHSALVDAIEGGRR